MKGNIWNPVKYPSLKFYEIEGSIVKSLYVIYFQMSSFTVLICIPRTVAN